MTTNETATKSLTLRCPCCQEPSAVITLNFADGSFTCKECDEEFDRDTLAESLAELEAQAAKWKKTLVWVDAMPSNDE